MVNPHTRDANMTMPGYKKFFIGIITFAILAAVANGLTLDSAFSHWPVEKAYALYFWVSLGWAVFCGAVLFVRVRRSGLWTRFLEAEATWRLKRGTSIERERGFFKSSDSPWIPIVFTGCLIGFIVIAILSAAAYFRNR
jgi:hypothetical protein